MTLLGAILIPIAMYFFFWRPLHLLPLLVVVSVFEVGSVFNGAIGTFEFGVAPYYLVAILVAIRLAQSIWDRGRIIPTSSPAIKRLTIFLLAFWAWSFGSAFVMPNLFSGIPVYDPRDGVDVVFSQLAPLRWTMSNLAQALYLSLNVSAVLYAMHAVTSSRDVKKIEKAFLWAVGIAVAAGLLQRVGPWFGLEYPYALLANNPVFFIGGADQAIGNYQRVNSTFAEASMAGAFLSAAGVGFLASYLHGRRGMGRLLALLLVILTLLATASTTGLASFALCGFALVIYFNPFFGKGHKGGASTGWLAVVSSLGLGLLIVVYDPSLLEASLAVTAEKSGTMSFAHRILADLYGFQLFGNTWGLGVGLGSNRPSSLVSALLSTVGIVGVGLFSIVLYKLLKLVPGRSSTASMQMSLWALFGMLLGGAIGVSDLNHPALWALFVLVTAQLQSCSARNTSLVQKPHLSSQNFYPLREGTGGLEPAN